MRQVLRQGQQLVMTQQLQQAIKLLQLSTPELAHFIDQQIESNPLLELDDANGPRDDADTSDSVSRPQEPGDRRALSSADRAVEQSGERGRDGDTLETGLGNVFTNDDRELGPSASQAADAPLNGSGAWTGGRPGDSYDTDGAERISEAPTLREHLHAQLALTACDAGEAMIGRYLIDTVDDSGYLLESLEEISDRLGCTQFEAETVLEMLQEFDPPGVFGRTLGECLALQLKERNRLDPAMQTLIDNLAALGEGRIDWLRRKCRVDEEDFAGMLGEIRALDPKPGLVFERDTSTIVVPDVFITRKQDGTWAIELNHDVLPRVLLSRRYYAEVKASARSKAEKAFLTDCYANGTWLVKALDQRAKTILKVTAELVQQQEGFFLHGVSHLRPLNLRQVADAIGMHESTVSRVTANKYLSCTRGTFELKYFFTAAIASADGGESHSAESVRHHIRQLIENEQPSAILSDDKIVDMLRAQDVEIARRTVAKYREAMHIPSSVQRRRLKAGT